ncbi:hypothetical protein ACFLQ0_03370 [Nitrospinota bacterium]
MIGLLGGLVSPLWMAIGGGALAILLWALIERGRRRKAAQERDAWRARAEGAERHADTSQRIAEAQAEVDRRTEDELLRTDKEAAERRKKIREAEGAGALVAETIRFFSLKGERREGKEK